MDTTLLSPITTDSRESAAPAATGVGEEGAGHDWRSKEATQAAQRLEPLPFRENRSLQCRVPQRKRLTVYLPVSLLERLRNTVYWTRGTTLAGFLEAALMDSLNQMEGRRGEPFPKRLAELKGGRPRRYRMESARG